MKTSVQNCITAVYGDDFKFHHGVRTNPTAGSFSAHVHERWELLFFLRGNMTHRIEGKSYHLRRGDLVLTRPSVFHQIFPEDDSPYERYNVLFDEAMIPSDILQRIPENVDVFGFGDNWRMFELFEKLDDYGRKSGGQIPPLLVKNAIIEVCYVLGMEGEYTTGQTSTNPLVEKALSYIDEHLASIESIGQISDALYVTKSHLHHLFVSHLGVTPKQYIRSKRLLLARRLIREGHKSTAAARMAGYEDYATFYRNYKKQLGYAPSEELMGYCAGEDEQN